MRKWISISCAVLLMGLLIIGCEKKESQTSRPAEEKPTTAPAQEQPVTTAAGVAQTVCPLMGGKINKNIFTDYQGKRVYFCCADCVDTFKKDPAKYIKQMEDKGIVLDKAPATAPILLCPKCGISKALCSAVCLVLKNVLHVDWLKDHLPAIRASILAKEMSRFAPSVVKLKALQIAV